MKTLRTAIVLAMLAEIALRADVTVRYKTEIKTLAPVPMPGNSTSEIHMKGNKGATSDGVQTTIMDFAKQEITLVDRARGKYATIPASEYGGRLAEALPQLGVGGLSSGPVKSKTDTTKTGRTEVILGVQAEESETTFSLEIPMPEGVQAQGMAMRIVMQDWSATPVETLRVPAIHQLAGFNLWQQYFMNGTEMIGKILPGAGAALVDALKKDRSTVLRSSMKMYMAVPGLDSAAPFMEMNYEIVELSTAPVDDAFFEIPAGYQTATFADLIGGRIQERLDAAKQQSGESRIPVPGDIQAWVPGLNPLHRSETPLPEEASRAGVQGLVQLVLTLDPRGNVVKAEALSGPDILRTAAVDAVKTWRYRPVLRDGVAVSAYTDATVNYIDWSKGAGAATHSMTDMMAATRRRMELNQALPRTPQQVLADLEQDSQGGDKLRRFYALDALTEAALAAEANGKAEAYATELLSSAKDFPKDWNYGNAVHEGHSALGRLALRNNDLAAARRELLEAGKTPGSPTLGSFGPNMELAKELLEKGEKGGVLEYFSLCRVFWKMGGDRLTAWTETVNKGGMPNFGPNLR